MFPPAEGGSKKDAKLKAAELALQRVFGSPPTVGPVSQPSPVRKCATTLEFTACGLSVLCA